MERWILIVAAALLAGTASAKMYKCQNPDGSISYQQTACDEHASTSEIETRSQSFGETPGTTAERIKRGYEALRTLRAAQLGITREKLDAYEAYEPIVFEESRTEKGRSANRAGRLKITESTGYHSNSYYIIEGTVNNTGSAPVRRAKIKAKAMDAAGELVQNDESYTDPAVVEPGRTATFRLIFSRGAFIRTHNLTIQQ